MVFDFNFSITTLSLLALLCVATLYIITLYYKRIRIVADRRAMLDNRAVEIDDNAMPQVSVIVYARDNSVRLEQLLETLLTQDYPAGYEVIVVNDGGGHEVSDLVTRNAMNFPNLKLTFVPDNAHNLSRRKLAITLGIKAARYDYILLLAAECHLPGNRWLASMARHFATGNDIVLGQAVILGDGNEDIQFINRMGELQDSVSWCSEALCGSPYRGSRYNMGYSKDLFFKHKGFARTLNIHDGDDDLFVSEIAIGNKVSVELTEDSIVEVCTTLPSHLYSESKKRHAFTARLSGKNPARIVARTPAIMWLSMLLALSAAIYSLPNIIPAIVALLLLLIQWIVVSRVWAKSSTAVGIPMSAYSVVGGLLRLPFHNMKYALSSRRDSHLNYTWHHK